MASVQAELLAPAGNFDRLKFAAAYGADAVYCGGKQLGLRSFAENFTAEELRQAADFCHGLGKKLFVTVNAFLRDSDLGLLDEYLDELGQSGADALIVTDPAVLVTARKRIPKMELHLSTQANTLNSRAASFWHELGIKRVVLARELSLDEIREIRQNTPDTLELEAFVHGAMCISYSGRCLLSNYLNGRDGNRGACVQPCRWKYELREQGKDGLWMPVEEDGRGTYFLNSRDLNMIAHLKELMDAGVSSFKIEGRMKTVFYVAAVTNAYRIALDGALAGKPFDPVLEEELEKLRHRPYTTGFYFPGAQTEQTTGDDYPQTFDFVAIVLGYDRAAGRALVEQRNRFFAGDVLEALSPGNLGVPLRVLSIEDEVGTRRDSAPHPCEKLYLTVDVPLKTGDLLRKKIQS